MKTDEIENVDGVVDCDLNNTAGSDTTSNGGSVKPLPKKPIITRPPIRPIGSGTIGPEKPKP